MNLLLEEKFCFFKELTRNMKGVQGWGGRGGGEWGRGAKIKMTKLLSLQVCPFTLNCGFGHSPETFFCSISCDLSFETLLQVGGFLMRGHST